MRTPCGSDAAEEGRPDLLGAQRKRFEVARNFRVLLLEDDSSTRRGVEQTLRECSYDVATPGDGMDALRMLQTGGNIDLVLLDLSKTEEDDFDVLNKILHVAKPNRTPVIVMSVEERQETIIKVLQAGAAEYLIKPIRRNEVATLWQHIWRSKQTLLQGSLAANGNSENGFASGLRNELLEHGRQCLPTPADSEPSVSCPVFASEFWNGLAYSRCSTADMQLPQPSSSSVSMAGQAQGTWPESSSVNPVAALWALAAAQNGCSEGSMSSLTRYSVDKALQHSSDSQQQQQHSSLTNCSSVCLRDGVSFPCVSEELSRPQAKKTKPGSVSYGASDTNTLPPALQEIVERGELQERLRSSSGASSTCSGSLHHCRGHSAFTDVVPRSASTALRFPSDASRDSLGLYQPMAPEPGYGTQGLLTFPLKLSTGQSAQACESSTPEMLIQRCVSSQFPQSVPRLEDVSSSFSQGLDDSVQKKNGNQRSLMDPSMLNMLLAMQCNLGMQQGPQLDYGVPKHTKTVAEARRLAAVAKFREKRKHRSFAKKVRYESRKKLAEQRPRVRGQFVKIEAPESCARKQCE